MELSEQEKERLFYIKRRNLRIVLVLSMIGSSLYMLSNLMWGFMQPAISNIYNTGELQVPSEMTTLLEKMLRTPRSFFFCSALLNAISLTGVIMMWSLRKIGFHLYTLAQLLILMITILFLGRYNTNIGDIMFTLLFITYYFLAFKQLDMFSPTEISEEETIAEEKSTEENDME